MVQVCLIKAQRESNFEDHRQRNIHFHKLQAFGMTFFITLGPFIRGKIRRVLCKTRLIFPRINGLLFLAAGHYVSFAKNYINGKWYEFNDSWVSEGKHTNTA